MEYRAIASIPMGRHGDVEETEPCPHAAKKEVLISQEDADTSLYVRVECDECGEISFDRALMERVEDEEDDDDE